MNIVRKELNEIYLVRKLGVLLVRKTWIYIKVIKKRKRKKSRFFKYVRKRFKKMGNLLEFIMPKKHINIKNQFNKTFYACSFL